VPQNNRDTDLSSSEIVPVYLLDKLSVSCSCRRQMLHIWSGIGAVED